MNRDRICAYYSAGPHFVRMLRNLREHYPEATLVAAIPPDFPFDVIGGLVDETIRLPESRSVRDGWTTVSQLRRAQCGQIIVMFDSPRLNMLARLSGARVRGCFTVDGRFYHLERRIGRIIASEAWCRISGQWHYLQAWWGTRKP